ncbi:MAG: hypothetical protein ACOCRK_09415 [bacterium]
MLNVDRRYLLTKELIETFDKQNTIHPPTLVIKLCDTKEEINFLTKLIKLIFFNK